MPKALLDFLSAHAGEMTEDLRDLVGIESPSEDPAAASGAVDWLAAAFKRVGGHLEVDKLPGRPSADHLRVRWDPASGPASGQNAASRLLLLGHTDTVWPVGTLAKRPLRVAGGKAYGPGAFDMKGGIILALWALKALTALGRRPRRPLTLLVNTDEETGSDTSSPYIEEEARRSAAVLVLEPAMPDGKVKTWRKGVGGFRLETRGRAAHAGADPEKGVSAIGELAAQILRLHAMTDRKTGTTVNVGRVGGGLRPNVVADAAWAEIDVRVMSRAEAERIEKAITALKPVLPGATLSVTGGIGRLPMERNEKNLALFEKAKTIAAELGARDLGETGTGGASDGNLTAALGVPTLDGLGVVGDGAHAESEVVDLGSMPMRAALLARMIETV